jgi:predicted ArsR family transcriptional regulator
VSAIVRARYRALDPGTSKQAARELNESGAVQTQAAWFLRAVRDQPGLTASELADLSGGRLDRYAANRRLADLERAGLVQKGEPRRAPSGRPEVTWWPAERQGVLL